jgi:hypothetical protein
MYDIALNLLVGYLERGYYQKGYMLLNSFQKRLLMVNG